MSTCRHCEKVLPKFGRRRFYCDDVCKARGARRRAVGIAETAAGARGIPFAGRSQRAPDPVFFPGRVAVFRLLSQVAMHDSWPADLRGLAGLLAAGRTWDQIAGDLHCSPEQAKTLGHRLFRYLARIYTAEANVKLQAFTRGTDRADEGSEPSAVEAWQAADARGEAFAPF